MASANNMNTLVSQTSQQEIIDSLKHKGYAIVTMSLFFRPEVVEDTVKTSPTSRIADNVLEAVQNQPLKETLSTTSNRQLVTNTLQHTDNIQDQIALDTHRLRSQIRYVRCKEGEEEEEKEEETLSEDAGDISNMTMTEPLHKLMPDMRSTFDGVKTLCDDLLQSIISSTMQDPQEKRTITSSMAKTATPDTNTRTRADDAWYDEQSCILDVFYYPGADGSSSDVKRQPCPAHTDPGLLTVVWDNHAPGLEIWTDRGWYGPVVLAEDQAVILCNRQLDTLTPHNSFPACRHRVAVPTSNRVSLVFEVRTNETGLRKSQEMLHKSLLLAQQQQGLTSWWWWLGLPTSKKKATTDLLGGTTKLDALTAACLQVYSSLGL